MFIYDHLIKDFSVLQELETMKQFLVPNAGTVDTF